MFPFPLIFGKVPARWNFDPANSSTLLTLTASNTIATRDASADFYANTRGAVAITANFTFGITFSAATIESCVGVVNASWPTTTNTLLGNAGNHSLGFYSDGRVFLNGTTLATLAAYANGDLVEIEVDFSGKQARRIVNGGTPSAWFSFSAVTGTIWPGAQTQKPSGVMTAR